MQKALVPETSPFEGCVCEGTGSHVKIATIEILTGLEAFRTSEPMYGNRSDGRKLKLTETGSEVLNGLEAHAMTCLLKLVYIYGSRKSNTLLFGPEPFPYKTKCGKKGKRKFNQHIFGNNYQNMTKFPKIP